MNLADWRKSHDLTLRECAERLSIAGKNPARTYQRIETGEQQADADLVEAIGAMTSAAVTAADMHATRLGYLNSQRQAAE